MYMIAAKKLLLAGALAVLIGATVLAGAPAPQAALAAPAAQGELLTNPGFEEPYYRIATQEGGGAIATGWTAWWYNDPGPDYSVPEYEIAPISRDPYRVHSGAAAQQIFRPSVLWKAGVYQRVEVPANARLRFSAFVHTWATFCIKRTNEEGKKEDYCDPRDSNVGNANPSYLRVGIDPTGGEDWQSPSIVWSPEYNIHDNYEQIAVEATAQGSTVTVFTYSTFFYPAVINNTYWDDASLVVIGQGAPAIQGNPAATTAPNEPAGGPGRVATQPPSADGTQRHIVRQGETLGGIAVAYGVTSQAIRDLNGISGDLIFVGQDLLIKESVATPVPTPAPTATPGVETPTPLPPTEVAEALPGGRICVSLFQDANRDGLRDADEALLSGGQFSLGGQTSGSYTTDGTSEPYCFADLTDGNYTVSVQAPSGYDLTALPQVPVTLAGGGQITLSFGAAAAEAEPAPTEESAPVAEAPVEANPSTGMRSTLLIIGAVAGILALAAGGGLGVYLLLNRQRQPIE